EGLGTGRTLWGSLALAGLGLPLLLSPQLVAVLLGMVLVGVGTFFAQATATGFVSRAATADRGAASGIYLACYFAGGLVGSAVLGQFFDMFGWHACVAGIALSLAVAVTLTFWLIIDAARGAAPRPACRSAPAALFLIAGVRHAAPVRERSMDLQTPVAIVGGGPVGLVLALYLDFHGIKSTLFNTETEARWHPKGNGQNARTMEHYRQLGFSDDVRRLG